MDLMYLYLPETRGTYEDLDSTRGPWETYFIVQYCK